MDGHKILMTRFLPRLRLRHNIPLMNIHAFLSMSVFFYPISILYFQQVTGGLTAAMGVFSCGTLIQVIFEIPLGIISDRWGRRILVVLGCIAEFCAVTSYALATTPPAFSGWVWLYLGGTFFGFAAACFSGNNNALLYETADYYNKKNIISKILGRKSSMEQAALALTGIVAATLLWFGFDFHDLVLLTLCPYALNIVVSFFVQEPPTHTIEEQNTWDHTKEAMRLLIINKKLRLLFLSESISTSTSWSAHYLMPKFISLVWPTWAVPLYRLGQNLTGAVSFWKASDIINRFGPEKVLLGGNLLSLFASSIAYILSSVISPFFLFINQIFFATGTTSSETLQQQNFSTAQRSTMASLISFSNGIFMALLYPIAGLLADIFSLQTALFIILICSLPTLFIYHRLYSHHKTV